MAESARISPNGLVDGERLTREEFLRRWDELPDVHRAEMIDGIVYMPSPVGARHSDDQALFITWLGVYAASTPGTRGGAEGTWLMMGSAPQPDATLRVLPNYGGLSNIERGLLTGVPELLVEVSHSSHARDYGPKLALYQRAGVPEYLTFSVGEQRIIWRVLVNGRYEAPQADEQGVLRSRTLPGLWLNQQALLADEPQAVLATLQAGLDSEEHVEFVKLLARRRSIAEE